MKTPHPQHALAETLSRPKGEAAAPEAAAWLRHPHTPEHRNPTVAELLAAEPEWTGELPTHEPI